MQPATDADDQPAVSLNKLEARRFQTDVTFRALIELEVKARREKTERLKAARMQSVLTQP